MPDCAIIVERYDEAGALVFQPLRLCCLRSKLSVLPVNLL